MSRSKTPDIDPDPQSPRGTAPPNARTIHVNRYELGIDVPMAQEIVAVDVYDLEGERVVDVRDDSYRWELRDGKRVRKYHLRRGEFEPVVNLPRWLRVVIEHVGVARLLEE